MKPAQGQARGAALFGQDFAASDSDPHAQFAIAGTADRCYSAFGQHQAVHTMSRVTMISMTTTI